MASKKLNGLSVSIGADTTGLTKSLQEVDKSLGSTQKQLREVDRLLKLDPGNTELIAEKQELLGNQINLTSDKLNALKKAMSELPEEEKNIKSDKFVELQHEIVRTEESLKSYQRQQAESTGELGRLNAEISKQEKELSNLQKEYQKASVEQGGNSEASRRLKKQMDDLNSELSENKERLNQSARAADDLTDGLKSVDDASEEAGEGFTIFSGAMAEFTGSILTSCVDKIAGFIGSIFELDEATEEYRTMMAKMEGSATQWGYSQEEANRSFENFYRYLNDDMGATNASTNLMGLQLETEKLTNLSNAAIAVWTAYGDSIPLEGLTEAINETAQVGKVTGNLADALNWAGISEDDFNLKLEELNSTQERADLIAQTLNETYGATKEKFDEVSESTLNAREQQLEFKEMQSELGEAISPVNQKLQEMKNDALEAMMPTLQIVIGMFTNGLNFLQQNSGIIPTVAGGIIALTAAMAGLWAYQKLKGMLDGFTFSFQALNAAMQANIFATVAVAVGVLAMALIDLWNTNEDFRNNLMQSWANIKAFLIPLLDFIGQHFGFVFENIKLVVEAAFQFIQDLMMVFSTIFTGDVDRFKESVITLFTNLWRNVEQIFSNLFNGIQGIFEDVVKFVTDGISGLVTSILNFGIDFFNAGKSLIQNVWDGIRSLWQDLCDWVTEKTEWLLSKLMFWRSSKKEMEEDDEEADGSHATGLWNVPFDGYRAIVHKGEMIVPAKEAEMIRKGTASGSTVQVTQNIYTRSVNPKDQQRQAAREFKRLALEV